MKYDVTISFDCIEDVYEIRDALTSLISEAHVKDKLSALEYRRLARLRDQIYATPKLEKDGSFIYLGYEFELNDCRFDGSYTDKVVCFMHTRDEDGEILTDKLVPWYSYGADDIIKEGEQVPCELLTAIDKMLGGKYEK